MRSTIPQQARELVTKLEQRFGQAISLEQLKLYAEEERNKPVIIQEKLIHPGYLGLCISLINADLVFLVPDLPQDLYIDTCAHELVHVISGLAKHYEITLEEFLQRDARQFAATNKGAAGLYDDEQEDIAEGAATLLQDYFDRYLSILPPLVRRMYRYGG